ncbi:MAG: hypothetical protein ACKVJU_00805 [Verrucomicrobiales bacterium]
MNTQYRQALRSEYFYNRLSLDLPHLSLAILAIDAAEVRAQIVREIEDQIVADGREIPTSPPEYKFSREVLTGAKALPNISIEKHIEDCGLADAALAKVLARFDSLKHFVPGIRDTHRTLWDFYKEKSGPIPISKA